MREKLAKLVKLQSPNAYPCSFSNRIPWFQYPIIYDIRARPRKISSPTGSKGRSGHLIAPADGLPQVNKGAWRELLGKDGPVSSWALVSTFAKELE